MDNFELHKWDDEGGICTFYTVSWLDAEFNETDKFFIKFKNDEKLKPFLQELSKFLVNVVGDRGAQEYFFRMENSAQALPPYGRYKVEDLSFNFLEFPLRLYCLRISNSLVVLFNGDEKTTRTAQEGKTSMVFHEANLFAKTIISAIKSEEIIITENLREFRNYNNNSEIIL